MDGNWVESGFRLEYGGSGPAVAAERCAGSWLFCTPFRGNEDETGKMKGKREMEGECQGGVDMCGWWKDEPEKGGGVRTGQDVGQWGCGCYGMEKGVDEWNG